jgi:hypothetical protein
LGSFSAEGVLLLRARRGPYQQDVKDFPDALWHAIFLSAIAERKRPASGVFALEVLRFWKNIFSRKTRRRNATALAHGIASLI